ncbi:LacI family DNA-binding transcriptional regulator [Actinospica durhamensis]|uniref:LacI family DNA-binding transcriptional regulator n=1 Tax=Actinospica durhamensis TaxID=1508375 RepID=A0A941ESP5_9ACTN|nr:LacI family DNA-binding transcriptional regulator [Actinospica durhamensis]MBR7837695.1 LacI family DNA-binding transcriptional regulator [Actinospica durhamensis]
MTGSGNISTGTSTPPDRGPATSIWEVARAAGVSHQTVSRVINGKPHVKAETRALVLATIEELRFTPNRAAQALAGGPVRSVTVLTADTAAYGYASALRGIEEAARTVGFTVGISVLEPDAVLGAQEVIERLSGGRAAIVIAFEAAGTRALAALPPDYPVVGVVERPAAGHASDGRPQVWIDDREAASRATRHLLGLGHRSVHYLSIPSSTQVLSQRTQGWQDALTAAGRPVPPLRSAGWTPRSGYLAARELVADREVTAILAGNDDLALGVLRAAREAGRDVPGNLSVIGFDDAPQSAYLAPALTSVRLDFEGLGRAGFGLLHNLVDPQSAPVPSTWAEPELILRESSGPAPR